MSYSGHNSIHEAVLGSAASRPDQTAVIESEAQFSYLQLERRIRHRAAWLIEHGVRRGDRVAVLMSSSADHLAVILALSALGTVHLSLSESDGWQVNASQLEQHAIRFVISDVPRVAFRGSTQIFAGPEIPCGNAQIRNILHPCERDEPWKIVQSSGSTGSPKAILQTHAMERAYHFRLAPPFPRDESFRFLQTIDLKYSYGLRLCLNALTAGGTVVLSGQDSSIARLARLVELHGVSHIATTPFHAMGLAKAYAARNAVPRSLRYVSLAGSVATSRIQVMTRRHLCPNLHVQYGANEVGYLTLADPDLLARYPETIGIAVPGAEIEVVDEAGRRVDPNCLGQIRARGLDFPSSYVDNPAASAAAFRDGWFYPGDLASVGKDGELYYRGRADELINFNGIKIAPADIEVALRTHPAIRQAIAFALPHPVHQDIPCAAVTCVPRTSRDDLVHFARKMLGRRAPRLLVILPEIPVRGMGKPDLEKLRSIASLQRKKAASSNRRTAR